jgi:hypothetical protein
MNQIIIIIHLYFDHLILINIILIILYSFIFNLYCIILFDQVCNFYFIKFIILKYLKSSSIYYHYFFNPKYFLYQYHLNL